MLWQYVWFCERDGGRGFDYENEEAILGVSGYFTSADFLEIADIS